jgi:hypothetical protein
MSALCRKKCQAVKLGFGTMPMSLQLLLAEAPKVVDGSTRPWRLTRDIELDDVGAHESALACPSDLP